MCSYREKKAEPQELLQLDGYTVDYTDPQPGTGTGSLLLHPKVLVLTMLRAAPKQESSLSPSPCVQTNCDQRYYNYVCVYTEH